ncbi:hypothetical protein GN956_G20735 [Arapaima gigas]
MSRDESARDKVTKGQEAAQDPEENGMSAVQRSGPDPGRRQRPHVCVQQGGVRASRPAPLSRCNIRNRCCGIIGETRLPPSSAGLARPVGTSYSWQPAPPLYWCGAPRGRGGRSSAGGRKRLGEAPPPMSPWDSC